MLKSINPYTNECFKTHEIDSFEVIDQKIYELNISQSDWKARSQEYRSDVLQKISKELLSNKAELAELITKEMGKPIKESIGEIEKCAWVCDYYAENGAKFLEPKLIKTEARKNKVIYQPLGVILAIMPWNFPFWQVFRFLAPNLMAGNVGVLKHASNVQECAKRIELIVNQCAGSSLIKNLCVSSSEMSNVIAHDTIKAVTLTGSERAGIAVAKEAAKFMKKCVFELGGSDPFIILKDADLHKSVEHAILGRFLNAGQSCIAAKRFIVVEEVHDQFVRKFKEAIEALKVGDPFVADTQIGPLAKPEFVEELDLLVKEAISEGGNLLCGGETSAGIYFPTLIANLKVDSVGNRKEFFGPVALVFKVRNEEEAIELASKTNYGLSSSVWTEDIEKAESLAEKIEAGAVFINQFSKSDPRLPFGGMKLSGYGRELGEEGIKEFVNIKTVSIT